MRKSIFVLILLIPILMPNVLAQNSVALQRNDSSEYGINCSDEIIELDYNNETPSDSIECTYKANLGGWTTFYCSTFKQCLDDQLFEPNEIIEFNLTVVADDHFSYFTYYAEIRFEEVIDTPRGPEGFVARVRKILAPDIVVNHSSEQNDNTCKNQKLEGSFSVKNNAFHLERISTFSVLKLDNANLEFNSELNIEINPGESKIITYSFDCPITFSDEDVIVHTRIEGDYMNWQEKLVLNQEYVIEGDLIQYTSNEIQVSPVILKTMFVFTIIISITLAMLKYKIKS